MLSLINGSLNPIIIISPNNLLYLEMVGELRFEVAWLVVVHVGTVPGRKRAALCDGLLGTERILCGGVVVASVTRLSLTTAPLPCGVPAWLGRRAAITGLCDGRITTLGDIHSNQRVILRLAIQCVTTSIGINNLPWKSSCWEEGGSRGF